MVRINRRIEHGSSSLAIRGFGREKSATRGELECSRLGGYGSQDCAVDSNDELEDPHTMLLVSDCLGIVLLLGMNGWMNERRFSRMKWKCRKLSEISMVRMNMTFVSWSNRWQRNYDVLLATDLSSWSYFILVLRG